MKTEFLSETQVTAININPIILIFLFFNFITFETFAQQKIKDLIIDTLAYSDLSYDKLNIQVKCRFNLKSRYIDSSQKITNFSFPNFSSRITIPNDTSEIMLPIDKGGSFIYIKNVYNIKSDSIFISKLIIDTLPINDTTYESIYFLKRKKILFFSYNKSKIKKNKSSNSYPLYIKQNFIQINNKNYSLIFKKNTPEHLISIGNGRNTKAIVKKSDTTYKETERYKRYKHTFKYHWFAEITLE
jgi:hypothetical protein